MQQIQPQKEVQHWLWTSSIFIAPHANSKTSSFTGHLSEPRTACHQEGEDDGIISIMAAHTRSHLQQHDNFTMLDSNMAATTSAYSTSTSSHSVWNDQPKLCTGLSLGVCFRVHPWPPHFKGIGGVANLIREATIQQELESRKCKKWRMMWTSLQ